MKVIRCTEQEFQAMCALIDMGIRNTGLRAAHDASAIASVLERTEDVPDSIAPAPAPAPVAPVPAPEILPG